MKLFEKITSWFKKKPDLRERCIEAYGPEFGEMYDKLNSGIPIGDFNTTIEVLVMIEEVKRKKMTIKIKSSR